MKKLTRFLFLSLFLLTIALNAKAQKNSLPNNEKIVFDEAVSTMKQLRKTSPFLVNDKRIELLKKFQNYSDSLSHVTFEEYLISLEQNSIESEQTIPILFCYRNAFDRVLNEVKNTKVETGTTVIWLLYNMGIIIKTPTGCFGIDVNHRWAEEFEPYLDFLCVTHNHDDHKSIELMQAMHKAGKPVLSNFFNESDKYCATTPSNYKIGNFTIRTDITDHNDKLLNFISVFRIEDSNFSLLHCGDSNFRPSQFTNVQGDVNLVVLRNGAKVENNIIGQGEGQIKPDYAMLSHIIELRHRLASSPKRFPVIETLNHVSQIRCENTIMPFWGEKLIWKNGKLK